MSRQESKVEYRWEAYHPDTGAVAKRGPIREDFEKVRKYAADIAVGIVSLDHRDDEYDGWNPAPYWKGLHIRIVSRVISPWKDVATETIDSLV